MLRLITRSTILAAFAGVLGLTNAGTVDAGLFDCLCPSRNCAPQTAYRTVMSPVPVTTFQPVQTCGTTWMQPCTTTQWQAQRVPVQTFLSMPTWQTTATPVMTSAPSWPGTPVWPTSTWPTTTAPVAPNCTCGFAPATTNVVSDWQPVGFSNVATTPASTTCPTGNCNTLTTGYANATSFTTPTSSAPCSNCTTSVPAASSISPASSSPAPSASNVSAVATPWQPATQSQYDQWQQQQNGQGHESDQRPDLNATPAPTSFNGQGQTNLYVPPSPTDWRPLQVTSQPTIPAAPSSMRPIPDPRNNRPAIDSGAPRSRVDIKPDSLLDRGAVRTASRQFEAVPIRWESTTLVSHVDNSDEGEWRSTAP